jgi:hypothetical protein
MLYRASDLDGEHISGTHLLEKSHCVAFSGPVILIFNKGQFIPFYYSL